MTAQEIENSITWVELPVEPETNSFIFKGVLKVEEFSRISMDAKKDPSQLKAAILRNLRERIMRKLYDDQREALYQAIYDLQKANPLDMNEQRDALNALMTASLRQQPKCE